MHFRSKMLLVIPWGVISVNDKPKCSMCGELNYASNLSYVDCEICRVWFHGDALDLMSDKIDHLIGFKCHKCLNKRPPVCPHPYPSISSKAELVSEITIATYEDFNGLPHIGESSTGQKSESNDEPKDIFDC